jgi:serine/threonine protein kinase
MQTILAGAYAVTIPPFFEKFAFTKVLGRGSYAIVLHATHTDTNKPYAIKVMAKQFLIDHNQVTHFEREVTLLSCLDSPYVVKLYNCLHDDQLIYLVTEYCELGTMDSVILRPSGCGEVHAAYFVQQLLHGICYLHSRGFAHRDLKPQNILVSTGFNLKLADFGFGIDDSELRTTRCGSPVFAAPEVIAGQKYHPQCADMWSLGVIVFLLATGHVPWADITNEVALFYDIQSAKYHIPEHLSTNFANFIGGLMQPQPMMRFTARQALMHPWIHEACPCPTKISASLSVSAGEVPKRTHPVRPSNLRFDSSENLPFGIGRPIGRQRSHDPRRPLPIPTPTFVPDYLDLAEQGMVS